MAVNPRQHTLMDCYVTHTHTRTHDNKFRITA